LAVVALAVAIAVVAVAVAVAVACFSPSSWSEAKDPRICLGFRRVYKANRLHLAEIDRLVSQPLTSPKGSLLRLIGNLLMVSGWLLVLAALLLLAGLGQRFVFVLAGLLVELLGLALVAQRYRSLQRGPR
jgi:hypothetical protein